MMLCHQGLLNTENDYYKGLQSVISSVALVLIVKFKPKITLFNRLFYILNAIAGTPLICYIILMNVIFDVTLLE